MELSEKERYEMLQASNLLKIYRAEWMYLKETEEHAFRFLGDVFFERKKPNKKTNSLGKAFICGSESFNIEDYPTLGHFLKEMAYRPNEYAEDPVTSHIGFELNALYKEYMMEKLTKHYSDFITVTAIEITMNNRKFQKNLVFGVFKHHMNTNFKVLVEENPILKEKWHQTRIRNLFKE